MIKTWKGFLSPKCRVDYHSLSQALQGVGLALEAPVLSCIQYVLMSVWGKE